MIEEINLTGNDAHGTRGGHRDGQLRPCRQAACQRLPGAAPAAGWRALAVNPALTPEALIGLITRSAERSDDGRRILMHAKNALAAALALPPQ